MGIDRQVKTRATIMAHRSGLSFIANIPRRQSMQQRFFWHPIAKITDNHSTRTHSTENLLEDKQSFANASQLATFEKTLRDTQADQGRRDCWLSEGHADQGRRSSWLSGGHSTDHGRRDCWLHVQP